MTAVWLTISGFFVMASAIIERIQGSPQGVIRQINGISQHSQRAQVPLSV